MDSWVEVPPVVPFAPNSGAKPKWTYFPNGPPPAATSNHATNASPGIFFIRDTLNSTTLPDQEAAPMCWTLSPPPPGWTPPAPPPTVADVSPAPPPPATKTLSPPPAVIVQLSNAPSIERWTLVLPPVGGWNTAATPSPDAGN